MVADVGDQTNEDTMSTTITRNGTTYTMIPEAGAHGEDCWYTTHPVQVGDRLEIARVSAFDGRKYPTTEEAEALGVSRYASSTEYTGAFVTMFVGLTAEEITEYGLKPTGANPTGRKVSTPADAQRAVDRLCNEE